MSATGKMGKKQRTGAATTFGMSGAGAIGGGLGISADNLMSAKRKTVEEATAEEVEEFRVAGRVGLDQLKKAEQQFIDAVDTEFWFAVCFQSRAQKDAFLAAMGWSDLGDKHMDGIALAERLKVPLPEVRIFGPLETKATLRNLALPPGKGFKE